MYFNQFPVIGYSEFLSTNNYKLVTNIFARSAFLREIMTNSAIFYGYQVKDGETPEIIADKLYNDPNRHWIVLLFNQIMNPQYEFPLNNAELNALIVAKYNQTIEQSQTTIHHYEQRATRNILLNNILQSTTTETHIISDQQSSSTTGAAEATPYLPGTADTYIDVDELSESGPSIETFDGGITVVTTHENWAISNYSYEVAENEKRRTIKLLDAAYVPAVENELRRLMRDGN